MDRKRILFSVIGAAVLAVIGMVLPAPVSTYYSNILLPLTLLAGFILALLVARNYSKDLKRSFIFLSLFLLIYMFVNIEPVWNIIVFYGGKYPFLVPALQLINYAMLIISCVFTIRVIEAKRMNGYGWLVFGIVCVICAFILYMFLFDKYYNVELNGINLIQAVSINPVGAISRIFIGLFDIAIVLMLVPVLVLYIQYTRSKAQESLTFALIMLGVIISLFSLYFIKLFGINTTQADNMVWLFSYLIIALGLYAHRRYDEYGFNMIEKALGKVQ